AFEDPLTWPLPRRRGRGVRAPSPQASAGGWHANDASNPSAPVERRKPSGNMATAQTSHDDRRTRALPLAFQASTPARLGQQPAWARLLSPLPFRWERVRVRVFLLSYTRHLSCL